MTAALACVIFHIYKDKYTSLTTGTKIVEMLFFFIFYLLQILADIGNLKGCSLFLGVTVIAGHKSVTFYMFKEKRSV